MRLTETDLLKFGHTIQLAGAVYAGEGRLWLTLFPDEHGKLSSDVRFQSHSQDLEVTTLEMGPQEWTRFLQQTDLLETEVLARASDGTIAKAILRKSQRQISQGVSWTVYRRDGFKCRYCAVDDVPLTVDHLVLWEEGGPSIVPNLVSACRKCNKVRGNTPYAEWLDHPYYRVSSKKLDTATLQANRDLLATLGSIPRMLHQPTHR